MIGNSTYAKASSQNKQMHYSPNLLSTIINGIDNNKVATIEYDSHEKGVSVRDIEPLALVHKDNKRHLVAWCRLRNDYRTFRLDRLNGIKIKKESFEPKQDFNINDYQDTQSPTYSNDLEGID
ncbi:MAG: WYL domain-containing protein [Chitinophagales bacterium]